MSEGVIGFKGVSYLYPSGTLAIDGLDLVLPQGKKIALLGGNGAGKSTFLLMLIGILKPSSGYLNYHDTRYCYGKSQLRTLRSKIGFLFHDSDNQLIAPTVYEELSFGLYNLSKDKVWVRQRVEWALEAFGLQELRDKSPHDLSAGQKKRVCMAAVLSMEPDVVVCDEPASSLDPYHSSLIFNQLDKLNLHGKTIIISTHDVNQAYAWADYIIVLKQGKVLVSGSPQKVFHQTEVLKEADLQLPFIVELSHSLFPDLGCESLPKSLVELQTLLKPVLCTDL